MKLYILIIVLLLSIFTSCTNQDGKVKIMSPPPPPPTLSSSLAPQPALLPEAPSGLALKQGYFEGKDGVQLFFRMVGSGKDTLVFVHGGPGLGVDDGALDIELIANKNYTFLAYDQRGGGRSELVRDTTKLTMPDHVGDLESLRKHFKIQKLNLIGLSWGSGLITYYHDAFPTNVNSLVFLSPMPPAFSFVDTRFAAIDSVLGKERKSKLDSLYELIGQVNDEDLNQLERAIGEIYLPIYVTDSSHLSRSRGFDFSIYSSSALRNLDFHSINRYLGSSWDFREKLKQIKVPSLVLEGELSNVPLDATRVYSDDIDGAKLVLIPNAGHLNWLDQPKLVLQALDDFYKEKVKLN